MIYLHGDSVFRIRHRVDGVGPDEKTLAHSSPLSEANRGTCWWKSWPPPGCTSRTRTPARPDSDRADLSSRSGRFFGGVRYR